MSRDIEALLNTTEPPELGPQHRKGTQSIGDIDRLLGANAAPLLRATVLLWHDHLDQAHTISQDINTTDSSYLHGIVHRREPDYGNAKYWFHRVPRHPIFEQLAVVAKELAAQAQLDPPADFLIEQATWNPLRFVDLCEAIARGRSRCEKLAREFARLEWQLLFEHCYQQAAGL